MDHSVQLEEALSWRFIAELWRRFPHRFVLAETHPCCGQYDCLSLHGLSDGMGSVVSVNRGGGSVHVLKGPAPQTWSDWMDRMLVDPELLLNEVGMATGIDRPKKLPSSTPETVVLRFVAEFLTHAIGRLDAWECRNGVLDNFDGYGGVREEWFSCFPTVHALQAPQGFLRGKWHSAYCYWFLVKNGKPAFCLDKAGHLHKPNGDVHDLAQSYARHKRVWGVIAETVIELLP